MRLNLTLLIIIFFFEGQAQTKGDIYFQQAKETLDKGNLEKAAKIFLSARTEFLKERNFERYLSATQAAGIIYQDTGDGLSAEKIISEALRTVPTATNEHLIIHAKLQDNLGYTYLYTLNDYEKALAAYSESIKLLIAAGQQNSSSLAFELVNRSVVLNGLDRFEEAIEDLNKAVEVYQSQSQVESKTLAECFQSLGNNYRELSDYDMAITSFNQAIKLVTQENDATFLASLYNDLGISYQGSASYQKALENLELAKDLTQAEFGKDADHYAQNLINLSNVYEGMGDLDASLQAFQEIASIYAKTPPNNDQDLIDVLLNLSRITNDLGMIDQSQALIQQALELTRLKFGSNSVLEADVYASMAATAFTNGEFDTSLNYNFKSISILEANQFKGKEFYAMLYTNIGQAYDELFEIELSLKYKNQALDLYKEIFGPENANVAQALENIGLAYEMADENENALAYLKKALVMKTNTLGANHDKTGTTYLNIGLIYLKKLYPKNAIENLEKARAVYDSYEKHETKAMVYNRLGEAYFQSKNLALSRSCYQKAIVSNCLGFDNQAFNTLPEKPDFLSYYELLISLISKSDLLTQVGDKASLTLAEIHLSTADRILVDKAMKLGSSKDRLELAQVNFFFTEIGIQLADKLYQSTKENRYIDKAFYYSERNKANELYADIKNTKADLIARVPKKLIKRQAEITRRINTLEQQVATAHQSKNQPLLTQLKSTHFDLIKEFESIQKEILTASPRSASFLNTRALPGWSQVRSSLDSKTALVSYTITDSAKYVLVGSQNDLVLKKLDAKVDLEKLVRGYRNYIIFKGQEYQRISGILYDKLWKPVEEVLATLPGIENVIIIPDGPLSYLPFETLGNEKLLIERYTIRYELSGALLANNVLGTPIKKPSFIALAPVFDDKSTNFVNKSCQRMVEGTQKTDSTSRAFSLNGDYIAPLPATEKEVERIHQIHLDKDLFSKFFIKEKASEEVIKKGELANYDYIHFATHGIANSQYPELSGLLLTQDAQSAEDGVLYTGEILGLNLKADLVTLSACETALGKRIEGEGVRGLTSSFLLAGVKTVVVSLWKVADESTSVFMIEFYNQLLSGNSKSGALRKAKLKLLADPTFSHPYYWAPFVQVGQN
jgi:CHAT domain-containing protein